MEGKISERWSDFCTGLIEESAKEDADRFFELMLNYCKQNNIKDINALSLLGWELYSLGFKSGAETIKEISLNLRRKFA